MPTTRSFPPASAPAPTVDAPTERLRIAQVTARYLPYAGGTEIHTAEVATRLAAAGHEVTVLTTDPRGTSPPHEVLDGVEVVRVPAWPRDRDLYVAPALRRALGARPWDVVHVQGYHTFVAPVAMAAAASRQVPFVVTFHSGGHPSHVRQVMRPLHHRALRPLLGRAHRLIGVSAFETRLFRSALGLPADRFLTLPGGSTLPVPEQTGPRTGGRVIASVGRVERYKGHHRLVAALPHLRRRLPGTQVWIIGDGPYRSAVERQAVRLGVSGAVRFCPVPAGDRAGMAALLDRADLVVSLSRYESQGLAVHEALALGRPVLVADAAALGDLATNGLVRAVPPNCSPPDLAVAIRRCLAAPTTPRVVPLPRWESLVESLTDVYHEAARV